jgi:xanthine dehydrogenase accessory factor
MVVSDAGEVAGSVSGGCVEGVVVSEALDILGAQDRNDGGRPKLCTFGYSDDEAFAVGLTCAGTIKVLIEPWEW